MENKNKPIRKEVLKDLENGEGVVSTYPNRKERRKAEKLNKKKNGNTTTTFK